MVYTEDLKMTTPLYDGADAAIPGQPLPAGTRILNIYVGATDLPVRPDTPHIWTVDEANLYLDPDSPLYGGPDLRVLPNFVHDFPADPALLANNACDAAVDMGWSDQLGRLLVLDTETLVDRSYVNACDWQISQRGFLMMDYGSYQFVLQNPPVSGGKWGALLTRYRPSFLPSNLVGQQWQWGRAWDRSVFSRFVYDNCGVGPRKARP